MSSSLLSGCVVTRQAKNFGMRYDVINRASNIAESPSKARLEFQGHGRNDQTIYFHAEITREALFESRQHDIKELSLWGGRIKQQAPNASVCLVLDAQPLSVVVRDSCAIPRVVETKIAFSTTYPHREVFHAALMPIIMPLAWLADILLTPAYIVAAVAFATNKKSMM